MKTIQKHKSIEYRNQWAGYGFIMPMLIGFLVVTVLPVIATFVFSFTNKSLLSPETSWVGMKNFLKLFKDLKFKKTMMQTLEFTVLLIPSNLIITLGLAAWLKDKFKGVGFFRTAVFTPVVISIVVCIASSIFFSSNLNLY